MSATPVLSSVEHPDTFIEPHAGGEKEEKQDVGGGIGGVEAPERHLKTFLSSNNIRTQRP